MATPPVNPPAKKRRGPRGAGTVYEDSRTGLYVGEVRIDGRRYRVKAKTALDARAKLARLIDDPDARAADKRMTVGRLLDAWLTRALPKRDRAPSTVERHRWAAAKLTDELGRARVATLTVDRIEAALEHLAADGLARASLLEIRSTLRQAMKWAVARRITTWNPAEVAELPESYKPKAVKKALDPDELQRLTAVLDGDPWQAMYALMGRVGLRPGEAAGVCVDALDLDGTPPSVAVVRAVRLERGRPVLVAKLKTEGSKRTLALPADVAALLRRAVTDRTGLVFTAVDGGPVWPNLVRRRLAQACRTAGVPVVSPNELRHACATNLVAGGLSPHETADILGHSTSRMVEATYRHRPKLIRGADRVP